MINTASQALADLCHDEQEVHRLLIETAASDLSYDEVVSKSTHFFSSKSIFCDLAYRLGFYVNLQLHINGSSSVTVEITRFQSPAWAKACSSILRIQTEFWAHLRP